MNKQEAFDTAVRGIIAQGRPGGHLSENSGFICEYRSECGAKCAIGHLIPDSEYQPEFDATGGPGISEIKNWVPSLQPISTYYLRTLQNAHDQAARMHPEGGEKFLKQFRRNAIVLAEEYGLNTDALN